jgi:glycosyltransferase involved in cell wall biosynthesis
MCIKDGATFVDDQLKSEDQIHEKWTLIVSDDGSSDGTIAKITRFAEATLKKALSERGPGKGACANFLSLANDSIIDADYFAFSDQDDVWREDKLHRALSWLTAVPDRGPTTASTMRDHSCGSRRAMSLCSHLTAPGCNSQISSGLLANPENRYNQIF